jgi:hypothetical protein
MALYSNNISKWQQRALMTLLGSLQGALVFYIPQYFIGYNLLPITTSLQAFVFIAIFLVQILYSGKHHISLLILALTTSLLFSYTMYFTQSQLYSDAGIQRGWNVWMGAGSGAYFILAALCLITTPFAKVFHRSQSFSFPYKELTNSAWSIVIMVFYAVFLTAVAWAFVYFWIMLIESIQIRSFGWITEDKAWHTIFTTTCFGYFLAVAKQHPRAISYLYRGITRACALALPMLSITLTLFLATLVFSGIYNQLDLNFSATSLILLLVAITILMYNGVYRDCHTNNPYPNWVRWIIKTSIILLPVYTILALDSVILRVDQYGLTIPRVWALVCGGLSLFYCLGYSLSILLFPHKWMRLVPSTNRIGALLTVVTLLSLHTPPLDPAYLSAKNQYTRLVEQKVSAYHFDYGYLEFELGKVGKEHLQKSKEASRPGSEFIRRTITQLKTTTFYDWQRIKKQRKLIRDVSLGREVAGQINYAFLRFNMKAAGGELIEKLLKMRHHPQYPLIHGRITAVQKYTSWEEWNNRAHKNRADYNPKDLKPWELEWDLE